ERGHIVEHFVALGGTAARADLLDGIAPGWGGRYGERGAALAGALDDARAALDRDHPERALPALARAARSLDALPHQPPLPVARPAAPRARAARGALGRVAAAAAGLFVRPTTDAAAAVPGEQVNVVIEVVLRMPAKATALTVALPGAPPAAAAALVPGDKQTLKLAVALPADAPISMPYWLVEPPEPGRYRVRDPAFVGTPRTPPALSAG